MKTYKVIQLMVAGALALGLNGVAVASPIDLSISIPVDYTNNSNKTKKFVDYYSFSLLSPSNVVFDYTDSGLLSSSTLSIFSDKKKTGPFPLTKDTQVGSIAFITSSPGSLDITSLAAGKYYLLVDAFLPKKGLHPKTPSTGDFTLISYSHTPVTPVPEPNVFALMLVGIGLVGFMSYRRQPYFN
jgi:hypothetical protein